MKTVLWHGEKVLNEIDRIVLTRLRGMVRFVERDVQERIREPKTGREYQVSKTGKTHVASAPGEAPGVVTGRFRQSVHHEIRRSGPAQYEAELGSSLEGIPVYLEFGTMDRREDNPTAENYPRPGSIDAELGTSGMAPRPVWRPALAALKARIAEFLAEER